MNFPKSELSKHEALQLWSTCHSKYAKEQIILSNYSIVFSVMQKLSIPASDEDMFQTGIIGLLKAINTFDFSKGYQFSTYAFPVVRNEILLSFRKSKKSVKAAFSLDDNADIGNGESVPYSEIISDGKDYEENTVNSMLAQQIFSKLSPREKSIFIMFLCTEKHNAKYPKDLEFRRERFPELLKAWGKQRRKAGKNMRVISQDGTIDMPYEQVIIMRHDKSIYLMEHLTSDVEIAKYSTEEKAKKAMEELRYAYMCHNIAKIGQAPPDEIDERLTMGLNGVFCFPAEEELE